MYAPPPDVPTRVFAKLPKELEIDRESAFLAAQAGGRRLGSFLEGPSFDREGRLLLVDIAHGRIFRLTPKAEWSVLAQYDGQPNGLKLHEDGRIFVTDREHGVVEVDPVNGKVRPFIPRAKLEPGYQGLNDLFFASNGDMYFTDQGMTGLHDPRGRLFRYSAAGRLNCLLDNIPSPNGLVMTPDEHILYLAVTRGNCVWRVPIGKDGEIFRVGVFVQLSGSLGGPDGMAMDEAGDLVLAHVGSGSCWQFNRLGEPVARIRSCAGLLVTNVAYGGPDNRTLFITESETGTVLAADLPAPGLRMFGQS
jgi:gluconolactonase